MLYQKNGAVSCVGSDFLSDWALYTANPWPWSDLHEIKRKVLVG